VHPTKREVRFQDKSSIFRLIADTARKVLLTEAMRHPAGTEQHPEAVLEYRVGVSSAAPPDSHSFHSLPSIQGDMVAEASETYLPERLPFVYLGDTLVAFSGESGLIVMDYHAAHERVNYERFLEAEKMPAHQLLFPQQVQLLRHECSILLEHRELLFSCGIEADDFGDGSVIVRSVPELLQGADLPSLLRDVADALLLQGDEPTAAEGSDSAIPEPIARKKRFLAAQLACHASVRGREVPDAFRLAQLKRSLSLTREPDRCPHGRPTQIRMSMDDLKKMFRKS
jgi:DNA mismatch repair protein MutL